jgi:hypothetical protein
MLGKRRRVLRRRTGITPMSIPAVIKRYASILMVGLLVAACATGPTPADELVMKWQGRHKDMLIQAYGPPDRNRPLADGGTELIWERVQPHVRGGGGRHSPLVYSTTCAVTFQTDSSGMIRGVLQKGCD